MVVSRHEIHYVRPLLPSVYPIRVETWVTESRVASFRLAYEVRDDDHVYAQASSVMVAFDVEAGRLRRFTREEREFIDRYLAPAA
jgi:acyl-CoA thioester hydrolase